MLITENSINELPIHDSDFLSLSFTQNDTGEVDILLKIVLYEGEYNDIDHYKEMIGPKGEISFLFKDCTSVNFQSHCGVSQRDSVDFIDIHQADSGLNSKKKIEIFMSSGVRLACEATAIWLVNP